MSALSFDPYAYLAKHHIGDAKDAKVSPDFLDEGHAKPAKLAKVTPTLASLATLAKGYAENLIVWNATDWQIFYHERAGIAQHDGGMSANKAEAMAYEHCIVRWMHENPCAHNDAGICPQCHKASNHNSVAVLNPKGGHLWLHDSCHKLWLNQRRHQAINALAALGIRVAHDFDGCNNTQKVSNL